MQIFPDTSVNSAKPRNITKEKHIYGIESQMAHFKSTGHNTLTLTSLAPKELQVHTIFTPYRKLVHASATEFTHLRHSLFVTFK